MATAVLVGESSSTSKEVVPLRDDRGILQLTDVDLILTAGIALQCHYVQSRLIIVRHHVRTRTSTHRADGWTIEASYAASSRLLYRAGIFAL